MKHLALHVGVATSMFCMSATAQEPSATTGSRVAEQFTRLDSDGDGRLSASEAGTAAFFRRADVNHDGFVTLAEAHAYARQSGDAAPNRTAGMEGDGAGPLMTRVKAVPISESQCPIEAIDATSLDGRGVRAFSRLPKGDGPFPAVIFVHGGLTQFPDAALQQQLRDNPVITRMLAAGHAVIQATFRTYEQDVLSRRPIDDVQAVLHAVAKSPRIDPRRIALFGGSGGGSIAIELGGDDAVQAVIAGEPATVLFTGMLTTGDYGPRLEIMATPEKYLTAAVRERTLQKLKKLRAPVLILHSDQHDLHKLNGPLFVPLMKQAGVSVDYREYPGYGHGFYFGGGDDRWGKGADEEVVADVVRDVLAFLESASSPAAATVDKSTSGSR